jgi:hypothetical protein
MAGLPATLVLAVAAASASPGRSHVHLLADPAVAVAAGGGAALVPGPVTKSQHNPLLQEDREWEAAWWK